jgi:hypothetical protein
MMTFLISDTFTDSLSRLTGDEQKSGKDHGFRPPDESGGKWDELPQAGQGEG